MEYKEFNKRKDCIRWITDHPRFAEEIMMKFEQHTKCEDKRMNKIKPCPFCGTEVELSKNPLWYGGHGYINCFEFEIVCPKCGCNVTYNENDTIYRTKEEAVQNVIKAWNKRDESNSPVQPKTGRWKKMVSVYDGIEGKYILIPYTRKDEELNNTPIYICDCGNTLEKLTNYCPYCGVELQAESDDNERSYKDYEIK